jgi:hypothetical protein
VCDQRLACAITIPNEASIAASRWLLLRMMWLPRVIARSKEKRLSFEGISATSDGAVNAVVLADGLAAGGSAGRIAPELLP